MSTPLASTQDFLKAAQSALEADKDLKGVAYAIMALTAATVRSNQEPSRREIADDIQKLIVRERAKSPQTGLEPFVGGLIVARDIVMEGPREPEEKIYAKAHTAPAGPFGAPGPLPAE